MHTACAASHRSADNNPVFAFVRSGLTVHDSQAEGVLVTEITGIAAKSRRIAVGDILVKVNSQNCSDLKKALSLLSADVDTVELTLMYGFVPTNDHVFDASSATFKQKASSSLEKGESIGQVVKRSLSFGKKKKPSVEKVDKV